MRVRTAVISAVCAAGLVLSGCSAGIPGVPQRAGAGDQAITSNDSAPPTGTTGISIPTPGGGSDTGGDGGDTGLPTASGGIPALPTGISGLPTDLAPGLSDCVVVATLYIEVTVLFMRPETGQTISKDDVDKAFAQADQASADLKGTIAVLHDAAMQAVGKSTDAAQQIVTSSKVNDALDTLSKYSDSKCGNG